MQTACLLFFILLLISCAVDEKRQLDIALIQRLSEVNENTGDALKIDKELIGHFGSIFVVRVYYASQPKDTLVALIGIRRREQFDYAFMIDAPFALDSKQKSEQYIRMVQIDSFDTFLGALEDGWNDSSYWPADTFSFDPQDTVMRLK